MKWVIDFDYSVELPSGKIVWQHSKQVGTATAVEMAKHIAFLRKYGGNMKNIRYGVN